MNLSPPRRCHLCEAPFYFESNAWGGDTCGDCIAAALELSLMGETLLHERKPMHRAVPIDVEALADAQDGDTERRSA